MLKRIAAFMVMLTMVFAFQGTVLAGAAHAADNTVAPQQTEVIALADNPQLAALNDDLQLLNATGFGGMKIEPWFWALSIIVPGLGQFLMGDMVRGLLFFFAPVIIGVGSSVLGGILATSALTGNVGAVAGAASIVGIVVPILSLVALAVYVWNVVDAYFMNQETMGMASIDTEKMAADVQRFAEFVQKNQLVAYQGGAGVQHQLATF